MKVDTTDISSIMNEKLLRLEDSYDQIDQVVREVMEQVKTFGNQALINYTEQFDGISLPSINVRAEEIEAAVQLLDPAFVAILEQAKSNIFDYHLHQKEKSWYVNKSDGIILGQQITPLHRVGVYVPGGKAAYPSTLLMNVIPALVAGVSEIVVVSPPGKDGKVNPAVLAAASLVGVKEIYAIGGAQAIAALTYGTETIRPVDKIVGPGNIYVARAKKYAFGKVAIDMIAGPSEICIIADESQNPLFIAADLLSQAEHDEMAAAVLITDSSTVAEQVKLEIEKQLSNLERAAIARKAIDTYGNIFIVESIDAAFALANEMAPEHLEVMVEDAFLQLPKIKNAGAIFLGKFSPEPLGDYFAGPNHTLPTSGTAKFSSPLGTYDFMKKSSVIYYSENELKKVKDQIIDFANQEGLGAHANSLSVRFAEGGNK
ncbi:histidinol dehydrogenase [Caldibacillus lycopersici]|uniref:Histidinol dehydrogenase n=1 Tax=Perspicuibacillus lycopersici TaxID=1325689 RepID=A0AAE3ISG1_9BACI|nr:histidinol dehydrogenase [Perspicuibacillus lycopersici]MCU9613793.1 histidinol dehydrogenase [Perspicuibacillus lycopersici]